MLDRSPTILVVDDHKDLRDALSRYLTDHGCQVIEAASAPAARRVMATRTVDLAVLDIMMPGESGLSLCRAMRETHRTPVILLSAKSEELDRIVGLEVGADDYVAKPFNPRELLARINAVLRRVHTMPPGQTSHQSGEIHFAGFRLATGSRQLTGPDGVVISLSSTEYAVLSVFLEFPKIVLTRDQLLDRVKGHDASSVFDRSIDTQISRLRRKLGDASKSAALIKTSWGAGYVLACDVQRQ